MYIWNLIYRIIKAIELRQNLIDIPSLCILVDYDRLPIRCSYYELFQKAAAHVYAPHMAAGRGLVSGFTFNFDTETHGTISHVNLVFHFF